LLLKLLLIVFGELATFCFVGLIVSVRILVICDSLRAKSNKKN